MEFRYGLSNVSNVLAVLFKKNVTIFDERHVLFFI